MSTQDPLTEPQFLSDDAPIDFSNGGSLEFVATEEDAAVRLDAVLVRHVPGVSRTLLKRAIESGAVVVNEAAQHKPSHRLEAGDRVNIKAFKRPSETPRPEAIPLEFLYEDDHLVAVNKPPGMVVHPAKGHWEGTLVAALAHHFGSDLSTAGGPTRPGIVHRLDRDTTGVIVIAKHDTAHAALSAQFAARTTEKQYLAIVLGQPDRDADVIEEPIGPHPHVREKMAIRRGHPDARDAVTTYQVIEKLRRVSLLSVHPKTGRTHQVRVHLAHTGHPVLCDKQYGGRSRITANELKGRVASPEETALLDRQALHAHRLQINHPTTGERLSIASPIPADMEAVLRTLRS